MARVPVGRLLLLLFIPVLRSGGATDSPLLSCGRDHDCSPRAQQLPSMDVGAVGSMLQALRCGTCMVAAMHLAHEMVRREIDAMRGKTSLVLDYTQMLEETCVREVARYGLQLDASGAPTGAVTDDDTLPRAHGGWVKTLLLGVCGELISLHKPFFVAAVEKYCTDSEQDGQRQFACDVKPHAQRLCVSVRRCAPVQESSRANESWSEEAPAAGTQWRAAPLLTDPAKCGPLMGSVLQCMIFRRRKWRLHDEHGLRFAEGLPKCVCVCV